MALSGGKDSTVVAHLARRVDPSTPLVFYDSGAEFPQTLRWMERAQEEWGGIVRIPAVPDAVSLFEQEGVPHRPAHRWQAEVVQVAAPGVDRGAGGLRPPQTTHVTGLAVPIPSDPTEDDPWIL